MTTKSAAAAKAPSNAPSEALLLEIAAKHFRLDTLETRNRRACARLDFHDVAVWSTAPRWKRPSPLAKPRPAEQEAERFAACDDAVALLSEIADLERDHDGDVILGADETGCNDLMSRIAAFLADHDQ